MHYRAFLFSLQYQSNVVLVIHIWVSGECIAVLLSCESILLLFQYWILKCSITRKEIWSMHINLLKGFAVGFSCALSQKCTWPVCRHADCWNRRDKGPFLPLKFRFWFTFYLILVFTLLNFTTESSASLCYTCISLVSWM